MRQETSMSSILKMEVSERIQLVEDVWDSIAAVPHKPSQGSPWKDVKKRILASR